MRYKGWRQQRLERMDAKGDRGIRCKGGGCKRDGGNGCKRHRRQALTCRHAAAVWVEEHFRLQGKQSRVSSTAGTQGYPALRPGEDVARTTALPLLPRWDGADLKLSSRATLGDGVSPLLALLFPNLALKSIKSLKYTRKAQRCPNSMAPGAGTSLPAAIAYLAAGSHPPCAGAAG